MFLLLEWKYAFAKVFFCEHQWCLGASYSDSRCDKPHVTPEKRGRGQARGRGFEGQGSRLEGDWASWGIIPRKKPLLECPWSVLRPCCGILFITRGVHLFGWEESCALKIIMCLFVEKWHIFKEKVSSTLVDWPGDAENWRAASKRRFSITEVNYEIWDKMKLSISVRKLGHHSSWGERSVRWWDTKKNRKGKKNTEQEKTKLQIWMSSQRFLLPLCSLVPTRADYRSTLGTETLELLVNLRI